MNDGHQSQHKHGKYIYISFKIFHAWIYTIENSWKKHWRENKAWLIIGCPLYFSTTVTISSICIVFNFSYSQNINRGWWSKNIYISKYVRMLPTSMHMHPCEWKNIYSLVSNSEEFNLHQEQWKGIQICVERAYSMSVHDLFYFWRINRICDDTLTNIPSGEPL